MQAIDTEAMDMVNRRIDNYMDTYIDGQKSFCMLIQLKTKWWWG